MEFYSKTDIGKKRYSNQDAVYGKIVSENFAWTVVCDGMGGANGGDIASKMAVEIISRVMNTLTAQDTKENIMETMQKAIKNANTSIFEKSKNDEILHGMGTTVVLTVVKGNKLYVMHAGDSRAYQITKSSINQIGVDHSMVQEMVNSGEITSKEARNHAKKNIITRALGINNLIQIDFNEKNLESTDIILICTDGLSNHLEDKEIYKIFEKKPLSEIADILISKCNERGGKDNITVAILKI